MPSKQEVRSVIEAVDRALADWTTEGLINEGRVERTSKPRRWVDIVARLVAICCAATVTMGSILVAGLILLPLREATQDADPVFSRPGLLLGHGDQRQADRDQLFRGADPVDEHRHVFSGPKLRDGIRSKQFDPDVAENAAQSVPPVSIPFSGMKPAAESSGGAAGTPSPSLAVINDAKPGDVGEKDGVNPAIIRAEVMLDRAHASPGVIDGRDSVNFVHALEAFEKANGLMVVNGLTSQLWSALTAATGGPVVMVYVLTDQDVRGPFYPNLPTDYSKLATLPSIGYRSASQKIAAKFHMGETLLAALNPGLDLAKAGGRIVVADVTPLLLREKLSAVVVDKTKSQVLGYDRKGRILVAYPATVGSQELPSPSGTYRVKAVVYNPIYFYDPKNFLQGNNREKLKLPAGPNNPVGSVFIALTKPKYGLHGSPHPSNFDKTASHGCVRMTNWDANELAHLVKKGIVVRFKE